VVVLAIDVSVSMLAQDVLPSRMEAAQAAALDFMDTLLPEMYAGVVSFDFRAKVEAEPTRDRAMVRARLEALRPGAGTAAGNALLAALELITASRSAQSGTGSTPEDGGIEGAAIILLSDGATTSGVPVKKAAAKVAERGVPVFTIAFGTDTGTIDSTGASADRRTMMEVASMTGGAFFEAASSETLRAIYADLGTQVGFDRQQRAYGKALLWAGLALLTLAVALAWRTHRQIVL
jgi:Ca-activated chloride channel family protein